jgi:tRNA(Ile)-lysidine synthase TilS/MesJ
MNSVITYEEWREAERRILEEFPGKKLFIMYSGGKDSSLCLDFMLRASQEFGFDLEAHAGAFPLHRYGEEEKKRLGGYWAKRGGRIVWHDIGVTDEDLASSPNPCISCQRARKGVLNAILARSTQDWTQLVLVPSFTLWDIVGYSIEHVLGNLYRSQDQAEDGNQRFFETGQRFYPVISMKEGYTVYRPLIKYNGPDITDTVEQEGIPLLSVPCRFKEYRPKRVLEAYYTKLGLRFDYDKVFRFAQTSLGLPDLRNYTSLGREEYLKRIF